MTRTPILYLATLALLVLGALAVLSQCSAPAAHADPPPTPDPAPVLWVPGPVLDQLGPTCVVFAAAALLQAQPFPTRGPDPLRLYAASQAIDGLPAGHVGTFVSTALDVLTREGLVAAWDQTTALPAALAWLRTHGPILVQGPCGDMLLGVVEAARVACRNPQESHVWLCYGVGPGVGLLCTTTWGRLLGRFRWSEAQLLHVLADGGIVFRVTKRRPAVFGRPFAL